jgi:hypothetical protein
MEFNKNSRFEPTEISNFGRFFLLSTISTGQDIVAIWGNFFQRTSLDTKQILWCHAFMHPNKEGNKPMEVKKKKGGVA